MNHHINKNTGLFERVTSIQEVARRNVVHSVNSEMVVAYWLIGREIVEGLQRCEEQAEYARQAIEVRAQKLKDRFGTGFMPSLGWSHNRALMRVEHPDARVYYEREAASCIVEGDALSEPCHHTSSNGRDPSFTKGDAGILRSIPGSDGASPSSYLQSRFNRHDSRITGANHG